MYTRVGGYTINLFNLVTYDKSAVYTNNTSTADNNAGMIQMKCGSILRPTECPCFGVDLVVNLVPTSLRDSSDIFISLKPAKPNIDVGPRN
mgnify:CR=1 FL=1